TSCAISIVGRQEMTIVALLARSLAEDAISTPAARSGAHLSSEMSWTMSGKPALRIHSAMPAPIMPSPMKPIGSPFSGMLGSLFRQHELRQPVAVRMRGVGKGQLRIKLELPDI